MADIAKFANFMDSPVITICSRCGVTNPAASFVVVVGSSRLEFHGLEVIADESPLPGSTVEACGPVVSTGIFEGEKGFKPLSREELLGMALGAFARVYGADKAPELQAQLERLTTQSPLDAWPRCSFSESRSNVLASSAVNEWPSHEDERCVRPTGHVGPHIQQGTALLVLSPGNHQRCSVVDAVSGHACRITYRCGRIHHWWDDAHAYEWHQDVYVR